jgi:hypothetical protein
MFGNPWSQTGFVPERIGPFSERRNHPPKERLRNAAAEILLRRQVTWPLSGPILLPKQHEADGLRCSGFNLFESFSEKVPVRPAQGNRLPGRGEGFFAAAER